MTATLEPDKTQPAAAEAEGDWLDWLGRWMDPYGWVLYLVMLALCVLFLAGVGVYAIVR